MPTDWPYTHFKPQEFLCQCGCGAGPAEMDAAFMAALETARIRAQLPFHVTSGFRCAEHNAAIGGAPHSTHRFGAAADVRARDGATRHILVSSAIRAGMTGIGLYRGGWVHMDKPGPDWYAGHGHTRPDMWLK